MILAKGKIHEIFGGGRIHDRPKLDPAFYAR